MYCPNCGTQLQQDAVFCPHCGNQVQDTVHNQTQTNTTQTYTTNQIPPQMQGSYYNQTTTPYQQPPKTSNNRTGFAVASLVLSLCSVVLFWIPFVLSVPGLIFGILGLKSSSYKGLAIAGIVISSIVLFIWVIILFIAILTAGFAGAYYSAYPYI